MHRDPFKDYIKQSEPSIREKGYAWHTAIGLQSVDGLKPSKYLIHTAIKNIEGEISIEDAQELLNTYYEQSSGKDGQNRTEEADKVSLRIAKLLSEKAFSFTRMNIFPFIRNFLQGFIGMQEACETTILRKKNGFLTAQLCYTGAHPNFGQL